MAALKNFQRVGALFLIIAATFLVYWPAQRNGFVWDDQALVLRDPLIRSWRLIPENFQHFLFLDATPSNFYRPLQRLTFTADYALWDLMPRGYHLTSIYVHLAAAIALYFLAEKLFAPVTGKRWAVGIAILWTIHPLHTSAVTYVAGRADPLAALFGFTALTLGLISLEHGKRARLASIGAASCFLAAFLSKESGIFALVVWLIFLAWRRVPRAVWVKWGCLTAAILAVYAGLRFSAEKTAPPPSPVPPISERPILAARAFAEYTGLFFAPLSLQMERDIRTPADASPRLAWRLNILTFAGLALALGCVAWWRWSQHRAPIAAFALLAALAAYLPISNLLPLNATAAEHWLYVPSAFLLIAAAVSLRQMTLRHRRLALVVTATIAVWAGFLGFRTFRRQADWKDQRTFLTSTIAAGGDSARMRVNLGQLESSEGRDDLALEHFREALAREPELPLALFGMAAVQIRLGHYETARSFLERAERFPFLAAQCRQMRASLEFLETKKPTTEGFREAAELEPNFWPARRRYIVALNQHGRRDEAIREVRAVLERESFRGDTWHLLGDLLTDARQMPLAIAAFRRAIELDVHDTEAAARIAIIERLTRPAISQ